MKISIVDTSPVLAGSTAVEAFRTTVELAQLADQAGYSRYWLSELHGVLTNAAATPEVAVAAVASRTSKLRVGSGGVLLNHRSPYRVAETFLQLHAMFPGRIDLGIGRATSGQLIDFALQQTRSAVLQEENYEDHVVELLHWFDGFDNDHPFAKVPFFESVAGRPEPWILGSLSGREREVMALVVASLLNKQVGSELSISEITVKAHRGRVMQKMKADSLADLVNMAARLGLARARKAL